MLDTTVVYAISQFKCIIDSFPLDGFRDDNESTTCCQLVSCWLCEDRLKLGPQVNCWTPDFSRDLHPNFFLELLWIPDFSISSI